MARKAKVADASDNFDDSHDYRCLRCGKVWENPVGHFFKSQWSENFEKTQDMYLYAKNVYQKCLHIMKRNMVQIVRVYLCATN